MSTDPGLSPSSHVAPPWALDPACPVLDRYRLGPEIGHGGMGRVHRAWDPLLKRPVALKLISGSDPELQIRFLKEAQAQAKVQHPHICRIHEMGTFEGRSYIAMDLVQGRPLSEWRTELEPKAIAALMADVAEAIHAAHLAGLIHRDLKPTNILVERLEGGQLHATVVDFGLAQDYRALDQTLSWAILGTPAFMSPEQARGEALGPATDIYSLGATLYAMLGGQPPYEGVSMAGLLTQQATAAVRSLRKRVPGLPVDLDTLTLHALEAEPAKRYPTALALAQDLRRFVADDPILARPVGPLGRLARWCRRKPALAATLAASTVLLGLLGAWNLHTQRQARLREQAAQRFGMEIRDAEHLLRMERMMPIHDIRPAEARMRARMEAIRLDMAALGASALGPGNYALARGHMALREFPLAIACLDQAWSRGFQAPEVAYAQGLVRLLQWRDRFGNFNARDVPSGTFEADLVQPARAWLQQSRGSKVEQSSYVEGLLAMVEARHDEADRMLKHVLETAPWQYEAWMALGFGVHSRRQWAHRQGIWKEDWEGREAYFAEINAYFEQAQRLAPSDDTIYLERARFHAGAFQLRSARSDRSSLPLDRCEAFLRMARQVRPDGPANELEPGAVLQRAFSMLSSGGDPGPQLREAAGRLEGLSHRSDFQLEADWKVRETNLHHLWWVAAEADWRFGRDATEALGKCTTYRAQRKVIHDAHHVNALTIELQFRASRGQDIEALVQDAQAEAERVVQDQEMCFHRYTAGEFYLEVAKYLRSQGRNPMEPLVAGLQHLSKGEKIDPKMVYTYYHLPRFHALKARLELERRQDASLSIQWALEAARKGLAINPQNAHIRLAEAEARVAEGLVRTAQGQDPTPAWEAARRALDAGDRCNPRYFELFRCRTELEHLAALHAERTGFDPTPFQQRQREAAQRGLRVKGDDEVLKAYLR